MNLELSRRAVAAVLAFFAVSLALLLFMLARLGTIPLPGSRTHSVHALFANAEGLPTQADVLVHGVKVGVVSGLSARAGGTLATLALSSSAPPLHPDAWARIGSKTPLGEPFVELAPGSGRGRLHGPVSVRPTVEIDEALSVLDPGGRARVRSTVIQLGRGASAPDTPQAVSGTIDGLQALSAEVGRLASELRAQRADLSGTISDGRVTLDTLAARATLLGSTVVGARRLLSALAWQRTSLGAVLDRLPGLLHTASSTLLAARPVIAKATPVVMAAADAAPALTGALSQLPATTASLQTILAQADPIRRDVLPALAALDRLAAPGSSALSLLGPVLADAVPVAQYLGRRGNTIAAWFANTADLGNHGDAKGDWARFFVMFDPSTLFGIPTGGPAGNSYTAPSDAAHNQPYLSGGYPRLMPYSPALGKG